MVITSNAGCLVQIASDARMQGAALTFVHPMDLLDVRFRGETLTF